MPQTSVTNTFTTNCHARETGRQRSGSRVPSLRSSATACNRPAGMMIKSPKVFHDHTRAPSARGVQHPTQEHGDLHRQQQPGEQDTHLLKLEFLAQQRPGGCVFGAPFLCASWQPAAGAGQRHVPVQAVSCVPELHRANKYPAGMRQQKHGREGAAVRTRRSRRPGSKRDKDRERYQHRNPERRDDLAEQ
jgi:hypothetical protein